MLCDRCGVEMRIVACATRPETAENGEVQIYHVNELACQNPQCPAKGRSQESRTLLWSGELGISR